MSQAITDWLESLPDDACASLSGVSLPSKPLKRKHQANAQLSSPPPSSTTTPTMDAEAATPTSKRQRLMETTPATDLSDTTPRPQPQTPSRTVTRRANAGQSSRSHSTISRSTTSRSRSELSSRSLSPKKQLVNLSLEENGLDLRPLDIDTAPEAAAELLFRLQNVQNGCGILPASRRENIENSASVATGPASIWRHFFKAPEESDTLPGWIPSLEEVSDIRGNAKDCQDDDADEMGWNMEVHHPILASIFRQPRHRAAPGCPLNFVSCTSARVEKQFLSASTPPKMVDFCIYYDTSAPDESAEDDATEDDADQNKLRRKQQQQQQQQALRALCRSMPTKTVNHTNFYPVRFRPIVVSIETKKHSAESKQADLQMAVWLVAQWASLQRAAYISLRASRLREKISSDTADYSGWSDSELDEAFSMEEKTQMRALAEECVRKLPFIPGIIVQGHKWSLVLSTREEKRTIFWSECEFGNTQSVQNTYKVIAGLREIAAWTRDAYLPWWRTNVLDGLMG